ncbi:uncharacterized protein LOC135111130 [Scylla paramamosain]|uniref:uncharacterized protein LOC135111130 n=1 Tax=Scylla paramamosain TaxID=85552 RepID=UPI003082DF19
MEVAGVGGSGSNLRPSFSLDFRNLRSSIRRQFKKDFYIESPHDLKDSLRKSAEAAGHVTLPSSSSNISLTRLRPIVERASTSLQNLEASPYKAQSGATTSPTKESLGEKIFSKVKGLYSSRDDLATDGKEKKKTVKGSEESSPKSTAFISKIKDLYSSMEGINMRDKPSAAKPRGSIDETLRGLNLLQRLYSKEDKSDAEGNDINVAAQTEDYWKGVQFLDKAQDMVIKDLEEDEFLNSLDADDDVPEPPRDWLEHVKPQPGEPKPPPPPGRRGRNSIISLNGSIHSISSLPTSPPPASERVIRNAKYSSTRRGKVARQTFQVYPKSFNQIKKFGLKLSRRVKKSRYSEAVPPVSASQMKDISVLDGVPRSAHNHDVAKVLHKIVYCLEKETDKGEFHNSERPLRCIEYGNLTTATV